MVLELGVFVTYWCMDGSLNEGLGLRVGSLCQVTKIVRHDYKKDPKRDPTLENYSYSALDFWEFPKRNKAHSLGSS